MDPRGTVGRIYKEDHYILLQTKYESSEPCGFGEEDFFVLPMTTHPPIHCYSQNMNEKRDNKQCLLNTPRRITVYHKNHFGNKISSCKCPMDGCTS